MKPAQRHGSTHRASRVLATLACGLLWAGSAPPAAGAGSTLLQWFPLEAGAQLDYALHRDRTVERSAAPLERQFYHGRSQARVLPARAGDAGRIRVRHYESEHEANLGSSGGSGREQILIYSSRPGVVLFHGHETPAEPSARQAFDPPLAFLREPLRVGQKWRVGTFREGGLHVTAQAVVLGRESLVIKGHEFPDALHVRYSGPVSGGLASDDGVMAVQSGTYQDELWLVRGVGSVRQVTSIEIEVLDGEEKLRISDHVTRTLDTVRTGVSSTP